MNRTVTRLLQCSKRNKGGNVRTVQRLQFLWNSRRKTLTIRIWGFWRNQYGRDLNLFAVGQGVESLGHILKVLAHHSGYDPEKFLLKLTEQHEFRFAEHHGVLELLSSSDACEEDVGEETEESQSKKGTRKRAHS